MTTGEVARTAAETLMGRGEVGRLGGGRQTGGDA